MIQQEQSLCLIHDVCMAFLTTKKTLNKSMDWTAALTPQLFLLSPVHGSIHHKPGNAHVCVGNGDAAVGMSHAGQIVWNDVHQPPDVCAGN